MATIRFFAAARDAAGTDRLIVGPGSVEAALSALGLGARFEQVVAMSTLLRDGERLSPSDVLGPDDEVDVLPPFAGG